jgi:hypothetical protein
MKNDNALYTQNDNIKNSKMITSRPSKMITFWPSKMITFRVLSFMLSFGVIINFMLAFNVIIFDVIISHSLQMLSFLCYHFSLYSMGVIIYVII